MIGLVLEFEVSDGLVFDFSDGGDGVWGVGVLVPLLWGPGEAIGPFPGAADFLVEFEAELGIGWGDLVD